MDDRFDQVEAEMGQRFERVEGEMKAGFDRVDGEIKELRGKVKSQGKELRAEIKDQGRELRAEMAGMEARLRAQASEHYVRTGEELAKVWKEFAKVHDGTQQVQAEIHALHRTMIRIGWTGMITLIAAIAGVLITRL
jgi:ElaB/YqjD/DUF883 family membrane-anchored ribosome-binding protein